MKKEIAIVVQRYGKAVNGGAEVHAQLLAKQLSKQYKVTILTTCAVDYLSWKPDLTPGLTEEDGVAVLRFRNEQRNVQLQNQARTSIRMQFLLAKIGLRIPVISSERQRDWVRAQGPHVPELCAFLKSNSHRFRAVIAFTLLYDTTIEALSSLPGKVIIIPTIHDEKPMYLPIYREAILKSAYILFNTVAERRLAEKIFRTSFQCSAIFGVGVEVRSEERSSLPKDNHITYVGRISKQKGCGELIDYFLQYVTSYGDKDLSLVMVGKLDMEPVVHPQIQYTGFVTEEEKNRIIRSARVLVVPSSKESLSLVLLEAMSMGTPVLVNRKSQVLQEHINVSKGGLYYSNQTNFLSALRMLMTTDLAYAKMQEEGRKYVKQNYTWDALMQTFDSALQALR